MIYTPPTQTADGVGYLLVRTRGAPETMLAAIKAAVAEVAPEQPLSNLRSLAAIVAESVEQPRLHLLLLGLFAPLALLLAAIGLYGLMAYGVAQRARDIGIRMALGAAPARCVRMVLGQGLRSRRSASASASSGRWPARGCWPGCSSASAPTDPVTYAAVAAVLLAITALASWLPARRAAPVDPMIAMRAE